VIFVPKYVSRVVFKGSILGHVSFGYLNSTTVLFDKTSEVCTCIQEQVYKMFVLVQSDERLCKSGLYIGLLIVTWLLGRNECINSLVHVCGITSTLKD